MTEARNKAREALEDLRKRRLDEFMAGFAQITLKLKEMSPSAAWEALLDARRGTPGARGAREPGTR